MQNSDDFRDFYINIFYTGIRKILKLLTSSFDIVEYTFVFVDKDVTELCSSPLMQKDEFPTELQLLLLLYLR